jgi:uncharacterized membrane protein
MRYGYHMGYGYYGAAILTIILIIAVVTLIIVIAGSRKNIYSQIQEPLDILRERFARGEIHAEEYREKKAVLEKAAHPDQAILILMKRYANGEISAEEYERIKRDITK